MLFNYQYTSDFAKVLQNFIDLHEIDYCHEAILNSQNFRHIDDMSPVGRYKLVREILSIMPADMDDNSPEARPYAETATFLLLSIPYENIEDFEETVAIKISEIFKILDWQSDYSIDEKLEICRATAQIYSDIHRLEFDIPVGTIWVKDNASDEALKYFNRVAAIYNPNSIADLRRKREIESELKDSVFGAILMNRGEFDKASSKNTVLWLLHEVRHRHQEFKNLPVVRFQQGHISSVINKKLPNTGYYALMEERQAYAFEGWISDHNNRSILRSELQITCDNLLYGGVVSGQFIDKVHEFYKFTHDRHRDMKKNHNIADNPTQYAFGPV